MVPVVFQASPNKTGVKARALLVVFVLAAAAGCEGDRTAPTSPTMTPDPTVTVRVQGKIIGERDEPIPGAVVAATEACAPDACIVVPGSPGVSQPTGVQGDFVLTNVPLSGDRVNGQVNVQVTKDGFEPTRTFVPSAEVSSAILRLLPKVTIRPGQSIETRLFLGTFFCGDEGWICRRVFIESAPNESVDVEVFPADGQEVGLIVGPPLTHPISPTPPRGVTMTSGEVWLYGAVGRVTVRARRRR